MFRRIDGLAPQREVTLHVEGRAIRARDGDSVAIALLDAGVLAFSETGDQVIDVQEVDGTIRAEAPPCRMLA